jgi:hypothetical protein
LALQGLLLLQPSAYSEAKRRAAFVAEAGGTSGARSVASTDCSAGGRPQGGQQMLARASLLYTTLIARPGVTKSKTWK